jgi:hypothetical protein
VLAGNEREALLAMADRLCSELGYADGEEPPGAHSLLACSMASLLDPADEALVARMRRGLAKIAAAVAAADSNGAEGRSLGIALDGAEMAMRGELLSGNAAQLPELMPSFVFLIAVSIVNQDRALELSRRASELLEADKNR